jgi:predicted metallopeptidase
MISYEDAPDIRGKITGIISSAGFTHIRTEFLTCVRSYGSASRRIIARCHTLPRIMQKALNVSAHYVIEVISEKFDRLSEEEKVKTLIHELMHIPKSFGGGFIHHNVVNSREVNKIWEKIQQKRD